VPGKQVEVWANSALQRARYHNVIRCSDVWICPVCANHITASRRDDLRKVVRTLRPKSIVVMLSFTLRHKREDALIDTLTCLLDAWRSMTTCRQWDKDRERMFGYVRSLEVTWGRANGWHPHLHVVFFVKPEFCVKTFIARTRNAWDVSVRVAGGDSDIGIAVGVTYDTEDSADGMADYLTKWGLPEEMTRGGMSKGDRDGGYTPLHLLAEYLKYPYGEIPVTHVGKLYMEYAQALRGKRQLTWSRSPDIRAEAGIGEEKSEAEIVENSPEDGYVLLARLTIEEWTAVLAESKQGALLDFAAQGDVGAMDNLVRLCVESQSHHIDNKQDKD